MRRLVLALAAACLVFGSAARAAEPKPVTPAVQGQLDEAVRRGRLIYAYDQAAWHATDELLRRVPKDKLPKGGGWVVEPVDGGLLRVTFFEVADDRYQAVFRTDMRGEKPTDSHLYKPAEDRDLAPATLRLARAQMAMRPIMGTKGRCTQGNFNTVVLPPPPGMDTTKVYLLSAMVKTGEYPFGGHYRFDVDADGKVVSERAFTKSCLNMDVGKAPAAGMMMITHSLDPIPTEIHVFLALWMGKPVLVATGPDTLWIVDRNGIQAANLEGRDAD